MTSSQGEANAATTLQGQALLDELRGGGSALPPGAVAGMAIGALRVRLTRSLVTMSAIVLAIAFLAYTLSVGSLTRALALQAVALEEAVAGQDAADIESAHGFLTGQNLLRGLDADQKTLLAADLGLQEFTRTESGLSELAQLLRERRLAAASAEAEVERLEQAEPGDVLPGELEAARQQAERRRESVVNLEERLERSLAAVELGRWLSRGQTGTMAPDLRERVVEALADPQVEAASPGEAELEALQERTLTQRLRELTEAARNLGRLDEAEFEQFAGYLKMLPDAELDPLREAIALERQKREAAEIRSRLRAAGMSVETEIEGDAADYWLLSMAMLTCIVGIANAMLMSVTERFREIGTMKCLGAQDGLVVRLFLLESGLLGMVGALIGLALGLLVALTAGLSQFGTLGWEFFPWSGVPLVTLYAILGGMVLSTAGAGYPAYAASRMRPVDALRVDE